MIWDCENNMAKLNSLSDLKSLFPEAEGAYQPDIKPKNNNLKHILAIKEEAERPLPLSKDLTEVRKS